MRNRLTIHPEVSRSNRSSLSELRFKANPKQKQALRCLDDNETGSVGYGGGGGGGKSFLGAFWCWKQCIRFPGVRYFFGRNELKNIKKTTLVSYYEFVTKYNIPAVQAGRFDNDQSKLVFENGSEILLLDLKYKPSDPLIKELGSLLLTGGFIDESNEVDIRVIDILYSRVGRWKNSDYDLHPTILETFNPSKDHVYHRFYKPFKDGTLPAGTVFVRALVLDWLIHLDYFLKNMEVHPEERYTWYGIYITQLLGRSQVTIERLLWGNFEYDDDPNSLIEYECIQNIYTNTHVSRDGFMAITADIALEGSDAFVIRVWDGWVVIHTEVHDKTKPDEVIKIIERLKDRYAVPNSHIVYDSDGVGAYVGSWVKGARAFVNGSAALPDPKAKGQVKIRGEMKDLKDVPENYENLKTQCYYRLATRINNAEIHIHDQDPDWKDKTIQELEQV